MPRRIDSDEDDDFVETISVLSLKRKKEVKSGTNESSENDKVKPKKAKRDNTPGKGMEEKKVDLCRILAQAAAITSMGDSSNDSSILDLSNDSLFNISELSPEDQLEKLAIDNKSDSSNIDIDEDGGRSGEQIKKVAESKSIGLEGLKSVVEGAEHFLHSAIFKTIQADRCTLLAPYVGTTVIGTAEETHGIHTKRDITLLKGSYSLIELWLAGTPWVPMSKWYHLANKKVIKTNKAKKRLGEKMDYPTINQCLAWLSRASLCPLKALVPQGEVFPDAEQYHFVRFELKHLPLLKLEPNDKTPYAVYKLTRLLTFLSFVNLNGMPDQDLAALLYAIGVLYVDKSATHMMETYAHEAFRNIFKSSEGHLIDEFVPFSTNFTSDPIVLHRLIAGFKASGAIPPDLLLAMVSAFFIHVSERAECAPDEMYIKGDPAETMRIHIEVIINTVVNVFDSFDHLKHKRAHRALISILHCAFCLEALRQIDENRRRRMIRTLHRYAQTKLRNDRPDDALIDTEIRTLMRRIEQPPKEKKGLRAKEEMYEILLEEEEEEEEENESNDSSSLEELSQGSDEVQKKRAKMNNEEGSISSEDEEEEKEKSPPRRRKKALREEEEGDNEGEGREERRRRRRARKEVIEIDSEEEEDTVMEKRGTVDRKKREKEEEEVIEIDSQDDEDNSYDEWKRKAMEEKYRYEESERRAREKMILDRYKEEEH